jgi:HSP20 family protein
MTLIRRPSSPFGDLLSLRQAMDRLFEESYVNPRTWTWGGEHLVPLDVYATDDDLVVVANLPGAKPEEVEITVEGNVLTIAGETMSSRKEGEGSALLQEIRRGAFSRTLTLPAGLEPDGATATFEDGVLTLRIPKAEQVKPRQIKIATGQGQASTNGQAASQTQAADDGQHAQPAAVESK